MKPEGLQNTESTDIMDPDLDLKIKRCMKIQHELDEIKNDPFFESAMSETKLLVDSAFTGRQLSENDERTMFISGAIQDLRTEARIKEELKSIKTEIYKNNLTDLASGWINDWQERNKSSVSSENLERRNFISASLNQTYVEEVKSSYNHTSSGSKKKLNRYVYLSVAAVLTGAALIFTTLLPASGEKLFSSYYEPFQAISPVMRNATDATSVTYSTAIKLYKSGDYEKAASGFQESAIKDPSNISPVFYLGLTDIEKEDYVNAVERLKIVSETTGSYSKEATWYLGLVYLKTGNILEAKECFVSLSGDDGYYSERSQKILRRLK